MPLMVKRAASCGEAAVAVAEDRCEAALLGAANPVGFAVAVEVEQRLVAGRVACRG